MPHVKTTPTKAQEDKERRRVDRKWKSLMLMSDVEKLIDLYIPVRLFVRLVRDLGKSEF